jgi:hypothetical protein
MALFTSSQDPSASIPPTCLELNSSKMVSDENKSVTRISRFQVLFCSRQDASASGPNGQDLVNSAIGSDSISFSGISYFVAGQDPSATLPSHEAGDV